MDILDIYPEYASTAALDDLRRTEYGYLDEQQHVYLDYTGAGLAARAQHRAHARRQAATVLGNPHSASPTSEAATHLVECARARVLQHLHASPDEYVAIFTPNATGAARLVGEAYRFGRPGARFVLTADNHNSINGLREYARRAGTPTVYVPVTAPSLTVDPAAVDAALLVKPRTIPHQARRLFRWLTQGIQSCLGVDPDESEESAEPAGPAAKDGSEPMDSPETHGYHNGLFAYPAQSNFSGVRHPLEWVEKAQARGYDVLLDAAAYLPTGTLDLSTVHPDFVLISWYKLFGYPTGVGCLVARRSALTRLDRPWFAGGTIRAVSVSLDWHAPARDMAARFEDGTVSFQAIPDVLEGLDWLTKTVGMERLQTRVRCLTGWFLQRLVALRHSNGQPMVVLYGPGAASDSPRVPHVPQVPSINRGSTVSFNFVDPHGRVVDERIVATEAAAARISLRTGCFCNPGAGETALGLSQQELHILQQQALLSLQAPTTPASKRISHSTDSEAGSDHSTVVNEKDKMEMSQNMAQSPLAGAIRVSFGVASNTVDVDRFFAFAESTYRDRTIDNSHLGRRTEC